MAEAASVVTPTLVPPTTGPTAAAAASTTAEIPSTPAPARATFTVTARPKGKTNAAKMNLSVFRNSLITTQAQAEEHVRKTTTRLDVLPLDSTVPDPTKPQK